ncbi:MAG: DUF4230 domain-containing protein [Eubacterium sp.]|nr:DUF4230 domain-containing protein [Eubacterium sp.]
MTSKFDNGRHGENPDENMKFLEDKKKKKLPLKVKLVLGLIVFAVLGIAAFYIYDSFFKDEHITVMSTSELAEMREISQMSLAQMPYNGVATVFDKEDISEVAYYVKYQATVKASVDIEGIEPVLDEVNKKIIVKVPHTSISEDDIILNTGQEKYMFVNDDYDEAGISATARKACMNDILSEARTCDAIVRTADTNLENFILGYMKSFSTIKGEPYEVVVEFKEDETREK